MNETTNASDSDLSSGLYDVPISLLVFLSVAYGAVSLAAIIGNTSVLCFVVRSHRLRSVTNLFIANLATADILIGALAIPFQFLSALLQRWILPNFMCPFCTFVQIVSVNVSIFTLTAIAADRYLIVANPIDKRITKVIAKKIIFFIWLIALAAASPAAMALRVNFVPLQMNENVEDILSRLSGDFSNVTIPMKPVCENSGIDPILWRWYNRFLIFIQYLLPVMILVLTYGRIGLQIGSSGRNTEGPDAPLNTEASSSTSQSRRNTECRSIERRGTESKNTDRRGTEIQLSPKPGMESRCNERTSRAARVQSMSESSENIASNKRKVLNTLVIIVALFVLCWLPLQTYALLADVYPGINEFKYINVIWFVCHFLAMSNSCVNPFVYAIYTVR